MDFLRILPWIVLSGLIFVILSYVANKYHGKDRKTRELVQDFIGGSVFIGFLSSIIPDIFPDISTILTLNTLNISNTVASLKTAASAATASASAAINMATAVSGGIIDDLDLQIGPISR